MKETKYIGEHIVDFLTKEKNDATADPELKGWLATDKRNSQEFEQYKRIWEEAVSYREEGAFDAQKGWNKVNAVIDKKHRRIRLLKRSLWFVSGAAAILLFVWLSPVDSIMESEKSVTVSMSTDYGNRSEVILPDGSVVKLNSGSNITYCYDPEKRIREIDFQGEGFFDVAKNKKPFVIKTNTGLELTVHGTSFDLKAYKDEETVEVSLVEGRVELNSSDSRLMMDAGDIVVFDKQTKEMKPISGVLTHTYSWLEDKLYMDNMSLASICKYLERRYDITIHLQSDLGNSIHYSGTLQEESAIDVLNALSRLSDIEYKIKGKNISITSK